MISRVWIGRGLSAVPVLMLAMSAFMKVAQPPGVAEGFAHMGWPISKTLGLAVLEIACTVIYLVPRTRVLGAILLTGYLGGATATHVRVDDAFIAPPLLGALLWAGLYVRDERLRALLPFTR